MPKKKYEKFIEELKKSGAFSFKVVESKMGKNYAKLFIHNLLSKGEIVKLCKGWYSFKKSPYMILIPLGKAYVGLGSAAILHGAWNQAVALTVLSPYASSKIKAQERIVAGEKVLIRKISQKMYFGYELFYLKEIDEWIRVSDPEKTLIDMIYFSYPFLDEILPELKKKINREKLKKYIQLMKKRKVKNAKVIENDLRRVRVI